ncbi:WD40 repeat-like protein [Flagelloscypha sp. PMI_526]|nr:WD40 repeat-like protein [Flagelloscypha sp. PMI_526]
MTMNYPYSKVLTGPQYTVTTSGPHIQVYNTVSGVLLHSTTSLDETGLAVLLKSGPIKLAVIDPLESHLMTCGEDKVLKVWSLDGLKLLSSRELPKRPTSLIFTKDGQTIVTADKFGDVFSYPLSPSDSEPVKKNKTNVFGEMNPAGGQLILGHTSLLTSAILSHDEKFIITSDRDEHIRVSRFPKGYNIEMYCLGHQQFVSALHVPSNRPGELISGGGDPVLKIWDWRTGVTKYEVEILSVAKPTVKARPVKQRPNDGQGSHSRKGRKKKANAQPVPGDTPESTPLQDIDMKAPEDDDTFVFCVNQIATLDDTILVTVVGSTSLFYMPYPTGQNSGDVHHISLNYPILDFIVADKATIYVTVDTNYESVSSNSPAVVRIILTDSKLSLEESSHSLLETLNASCIVATEADLKSLDLYNSLVSMPKSNEEYEDPSETNNPDRTGKKKAARLRVEQALQQARTGKHEQDVTEGSEPDKKRHKSGTDAAL